MKFLRLYIIYLLFVANHTFAQNSKYLRFDTGISFDNKLSSNKISLGAGYYVTDRFRIEAQFGFKTKSRFKNISTNYFSRIENIDDPPNGPGGGGQNDPPPHIIFEYDEKDLANLIGSNEDDEGFIFLSVSLDGNIAKITDFPKVTPPKEWIDAFSRVIENQAQPGSKAFEDFDRLDREYRGLNNLTNSNSDETLPRPPKKPKEKIVTSPYQSINILKYHVYSFMLNGHYDLINIRNMSIYSSIGLGASHIKTNFNFINHKSPRNISFSKTNFTYCLGIGSSIKITQNIKAIIQYSLYNYGKIHNDDNFKIGDVSYRSKLKSHIISLGLQLKL